MAAYKKIATILFVIVIIIGIAHQFTVVQHATARFTAAIYVAIKYQHMDLKYQKLEYSPQFGNYFVFYKDTTEQVYAFELTPRMIPILVSYDPLYSGP